MEAAWSRGEAAVWRIARPTTFRSHRAWLLLLAGTMPDV